MKMSRIAYHAFFPFASGVLLSASWFILTPLNMRKVNSVVLGFFVGSVVYMTLDVIFNLGEKE